MRQLASGHLVLKKVAKGGAERHQVDCLQVDKSYRSLSL
jgi:hypothetical protein